MRVGPEIRGNDKEITLNMMSGPLLIRKGKK